MLALIAGRGRLPEILAERTGAEIIGLRGVSYDALRPEKNYGIEALGSLIADCVSAGVTAVCFAGGLTRVPLDPTKLDQKTLPLVPRMMEALAAGDDAALRTVVAFFEEAGIRTVGAHELCPELLPVAGSYGGVAPDGFETDADRGWEVIAALGAADVGQSCVVQDGQVLAVEALFGTDWMLDSLKDRPRGAGGLLCKAAKPGQDLRVDMPTVGPDTVRKLADLGLNGLVIKSGEVMVLDQEEPFALARARGLLFWVRE
ncbi:MAG: UDP-2,3-diacylglucosamine diphosphatase LpxI [Paracoccaceae bacterium]|nr:UDP-2,3-diacylglucosamine diphosphatase LpxI [Paracoccaceae bacterium]